MRWLPAIRAFLGSIDSHLELEETFIPALQREGDCFLMDKALDQNFSPTELQLISARRCYKGVTLLSDAVSADGTEIRIDSMNSGPPINTPKGQMPYQDNSSPKAWSLWKRLLSQFTLGTTTCLEHDLGRWFITGPDTLHQWQSYYCSVTDTVYLKKGALYETYHRHQNEFLYSGQDAEEVPKIAVPADLTLHTDKIHLLETTPIFP